MRRRYGTLYFYVLREILVSVAIAFLFFFFIFFVNQLLLMAERILSKKVPLADVAVLVLYSVPIIVTYSLPFGTLVGALMAIGRMSSDNEMLAFKASGVSLLRVLVPLVFAGVLFSLLAFGFGDFFLPLGNIRLKTLLKQVIFRNPGIELAPYSVKRYENTVLITGEVVGNRIGNLVIIDRTGENKKRIITARQAFLEPNLQQTGAISLRLIDAFTHVSDPKKEGTYEYGTADTMVYNLLLKDISVSMVNPGPAEMSSIDVWNEIQVKKVKFQERIAKKEEVLERLRLDLVMEVQSSLATLEERLSLPEERVGAMRRAYDNLENERAKPVFDRNLQSYLMEFHRKIASPFSCLVFIIVALPMGLFAKRSGRSVGFGIGIVMSGMYWSMLLVSFRLGSRMNVSPLLSMWTPNIIVFTIGISLLLRKLRQ